MMHCKEKKRFDVAIVGAGLSGVMLVLEMLKNNATKNKQILLLDKGVKDNVSKTWCFWEQDSSAFEKIITKKWSKAEIFAGDLKTEFDMQPYTYNMLKSEDFFQYALSIIRQSANVLIAEADIIDLLQMGSSVMVVANEGIYIADIVFDSRFPEKAIELYDGPVLQQQFVGWFVRSKNAIFDPHTIRLMDFRMKQEQKVAFCYMLPTSENEALIEYTVFTEKMIERTELEAGVRDYIVRHFPYEQMDVQAKEAGIIPMGGFDLTKKYERIIPIGTAGGCTKPSSGYTFTFVRQHTLHIIDALVKNKMPQAYSDFIPRRFLFYDKVLLRVLIQHPDKGKEIFFRLFKRNKAAIVICFLHNVSSIKNELLIFSKLPALTFFKSAIRELLATKSMAALPENAVGLKATTRMDESVLEDVAAKMELLPIVFKKAFSLYIKGYDYDEISNMLHIPVESIKSRINFTRQILEASRDSNYD